MFMIPLGFIYKTTCIPTGKIYVGKHEFSLDKRRTSTYLGSGIILRKAIKKHSEETKDKNRQRHLGKKPSEETRRRMREASKKVQHYWSTKRKVG